MQHSDEMEKLFDEVEKYAKELELLNPNHEHLQYDFDGKSEEEKDRLTVLFCQKFGPKGVGSTIPSGEVFELAVRSLLTEIKAAIFIEKAKTGFRQQP